ncbi:MAG: InlB B-repeat-containing protein [Eubacteriales bacterium]|nr:InlB B-repeat-containing protein [Eubacteriales bacterium]
MKFTAKEFKRSIAVILAFTMAFSSPVSTLADYNAAEMPAAELIYAETVSAGEEDLVAEETAGEADAAFSVTDGAADSVEAAVAEEGEIPGEAAGAETEGGAPENSLPDDRDAEAGSNDGSLGSGSFGFVLMENLPDYFDKYITDTRASFFLKQDLTLEENIFLRTEQHNKPVTINLNGHTITGNYDGPLLDFGWGYPDYSTDNVYIDGINAADKFSPYGAIRNLNTSGIAIRAGEKLDLKYLTVKSAGEAAVFSGRIANLDAYDSPVPDTELTAESVTIRSEGDGVKFCEPEKSYSVAFNNDYNMPITVTAGSGKNAVSLGSAASSLTINGGYYQGSISLPVTGENLTCVTGGFYADDSVAQYLHIVGNCNYVLASRDPAVEGCGYEVVPGCKVDFYASKEAAQSGDLSAAIAASQYIPRDGLVKKPKVGPDDGRLPVSFRELGVNTDWNFDTDTVVWRNSLSLYVTQWAAPEVEIIHPDSSKNPEYFVRLTDALSYSRKNSSEDYHMDHLLKGDTVRLLQDVELETSQILHFYWRDKNYAMVDGYTVDLNGHTITGQTNDSGVIYVDRTAFTIKDSSTEKKGAIINKGSSAVLYGYLYSMRSSGYDKNNIILRDGVELTAAGNDVVVIYDYENNYGNGLTIEDAVLRHEPENASANYLRFMKSGSAFAIEIKKGFFDGNYRVDAGTKVPTVKLSGGYYTKKPEESSLASGCEIFEDPSDIPVGFEDYKYAVGEAAVVTFNMKGAGTAPAPVKVKKGTKLPAFPELSDNDKYMPKGWYTKDGTSGDWGKEWNLSDPVNSDITLYLKWVAPEVVIYRSLKPFRYFEKLTEAVEYTGTYNPVRMRYLQQNDTLKLLRDVTLEDGEQLHFYWKDADGWDISLLLLDLNGHSITGNHEGELLYVDRISFYIFGPGNISNQSDEGSAVYAYFNTKSPSRSKERLQIWDKAVLESGGKVLSVYGYEGGSNIELSILGSVLKHTAGHSGDFLYVHKYTSLNAVIGNGSYVGYFDGTITGCDYADINITSGHFTERLPESLLGDGYRMVEDTTDLPPEFAKYKYTPTKAEVCTVSFSMNGSTRPVPGSIAVKKGAKISELPVLADGDDLIFRAWYKDQECTQVWNLSEDLVNSDTTLYLGWAAPEAKILRGTKTIYVEKLKEISVGYQASAGKHAVSGDTVVLLTDVDLVAETDPQLIFHTPETDSTMSEYTLDLNGNVLSGNVGYILDLRDVKLTVTGGGAIKNLGERSGAAIGVSSGECSGKFAKKADIIIDDAVLTAHNAIFIDVPSYSASVTINGGNFFGKDSGSSIRLQKGTITLSVTGGRFDSPITYNTDSGAVKIAGGITGGLFKAEPAQHLIAAGYTCSGSDDSDYPYTVAKAENIVLNVTTGVYYASLQEAFDAAGTGDVIRLLKNITASATVPENASIIFDLNGYTVSADGRKCIIIVSGGAAFTLRDSSPASGGKLADADYPDRGGAVNVGKGAVFTMESGTITNCKANVGGAVHVKEGTFHMKGGKITACSSDSIASAVYVDNGQCNMTGGEISGCLKGDGALRYYQSQGRVDGSAVIRNNGETEGTYRTGWFGGIAVIESYVTVSGGTFSGNGGTGTYGEGIYVNNKNQGTVFISGGSFTAKTPGAPLVRKVGDRQDLFVNGGTFDYNGTAVQSPEWLGFVMNGCTAAPNAERTVWTVRSPFQISYRDQNDAEFSGIHEAGYPKAHYYGSDTQLKKAYKDGCAFDGWFTDPECGGAPVAVLGGSDYITDITLYAKWTETTPVAKIGEKTFVTLQEAFNAVQNGETITLLSDIVQTEPAMLRNDDFGRDITVTLDLDSHSVTGDLTDTQVIGVENASLTLKNGTVNNTGASSSCTRAVYLWNGYSSKIGTLTLENMTVTAPDRAVETYGNYGNVVSLMAADSVLKADSYAIYAEKGFYALSIYSSDRVKGTILYSGFGKKEMGITGGYFSVAPNASYLASGAAVFLTDDQDPEVKSEYPYAVDTAHKVEFKVDGRWYGGPQKIRNGRLAAKPADPAGSEHQTFAGWYTKDGRTSGDWGSEWNFAEYPVTEYTLLYAKFNTDTFTVSFDLNGHGAEGQKPADQTVAYGGFVREPEDPADESRKWIFYGWYRSSACSAGEKWYFTRDQVEKTTTLYAKWLPADIQVIGPDGKAKKGFAETGDGLSLWFAVTSASNGDTVKLLSDLTAVAGPVISQKAITADLCGHSIHALDGQSFVFLIGYGGTLTLANSSETSFASVFGKNDGVQLNGNALLKVEAKNVAVTGETGAAVRANDRRAVVQISGGRYAGGEGAVAEEISGENTISVSGGLFSHALPQEFLAEGYYCVPNTDPSTKEDYPYVVRNDVAVVKFDTAGHGKVPEDQIVVKGSHLADPGITEAEGGYLLAGWYADPSFEGAPWNFAEDKVSASMTLTAKWELAEVLYAEYDSEEKYELHPVSTFNEAVAKIDASQKTKHVIVLNRDIEHASPRVFTKKTELDLNGKVFTGDSVSSEKEYLIKAENCDLTVRDSSASAAGMIYNTSEDASSAAVLLVEEMGSNGSHTFAFEGGTVCGVSAVKANEYYARILVNSEEACLMGLSVPEETDESGAVTKAAVTGSAFTFTNPSMQLSVSGGSFAGRFGYAGTGELSLSEKLTGGRFTEKPAEGLITNGYGAVYADDPWYRYEVKEAVKVHFADNLHPEKIPDQTVALGGKVTDPGDPASEGRTFEGWYTKDGSSTDPQTGEPDWGKKWNFAEDVITDELYAQKAFTLYAKWTKCEAMIERTESGEKKTHRYETLAEAVAASKRGAYPDETVILETDVSLNGTLVIDKNLKLDLNEKTLNADAEMAENVPLLSVADKELCIVADFASYIKNPGKTAITVTGENGQLTIARDAKVFVSGAVTYTAPAKGRTAPAEGHGIMGGFYTADPAKELIAAGYAAFKNEESEEYTRLVDKAWNVTFCISEAESSVFVIRDGHTASAPVTPQREGFLFDGWWTKKEDGTWDQKWDFRTPVTADLTLTAKFDAVEAKLQYYTYPEASEESGQEPVSVFVTENFRTLAEAVEKANSLNDSNAVLTLCADITLSDGETIELNIGQPWRLTFDLNGHTLSGAVDTAADSGKKALVEVKNAVTFKDSSQTETAAGTGAIINTAGNAVFYKVPMAGGIPNLEIESGTFTAGTFADEAFTAAGSAVEVSDADARLKISGGKFAGPVLYTGDTPEGANTRALISGGLYTAAPFGKYLEKGYAIKDLGETETYRYQVEQESYTVHFEANGGTPVPEDQTGLHYGDKVTMPPAMTKTDAEHPEKVYLFDGWYTKSQPASDAQTSRAARIWNFDNDTIEGNMTLYAWWSEAVASVTYTPAGGEQKTETYVALADAVKVATENSGAILKLLASVVGPLTIEEPAEKTLTLDLNGRNITAAGTSVSALNLTGEGTVTVTDTAAAKGSVTYPKGAAITISAGTLLIKDGNIGAAPSAGVSTYAVKYTDPAAPEEGTAAAVTITGGRIRGGLFGDSTKCPITLTGGHFDSIKSGFGIKELSEGISWIYDGSDAECPYTIGTAAASYNAGGKSLNFAAIDEALAYAKTNAGGTLTLLADVTAHGGTGGKNTPIVIPAAMTLDLNGHDMIFAVAGEGQPYESSAYPVLYAEGGDLVIRNSQAQKTGTVQNTAEPQKQGTEQSEVTIPPTVINADHKLSIESGNFGGQIFCAVGDITGGDFSIDPTGKLRTGYKATKTGSTEFPYQVSIMNFTLVFDANGGTFKKHSGQQLSVIKNYGESVSRDEVEVSSFTHRFDGWQYEVTITEKTVEGTEEKTTTRKETRTWNFEPVTRNIPGAVEGNVSYTGPITAQWSKYVAQIGDSYYTSLQDAVQAAGPGATITLLENIAESVSVFGKNLTIDLAGHTISSGSGAGTLKIVESTVTIKGSGTVTNSGSGSGIYMSDSNVTIDGTGTGSTQVTSSGGNGITANQKTNNTLRVEDTTVKGKTNGVSGDKSLGEGKGKFDQEYDKCRIEGEEDSALDETMWSDNASVTSESSDFVGDECGIKADNIEYNINGGSVKGGTNALQILGVAAGTIAGAALIGAIVYAKYKEYKLILYGCAIVVGVTIAVELLNWLLGSDGGKNHHNDVKVPVEFYSKNERQASYSMKVGTYVGGDKAKAGNLTKEEVLVGWKESAPYVVDPVTFPVRVENYTRFDAKIEGKKTVKFNTIVDLKPTVRDTEKPAEQKVKYGDKATEPPATDRLPLDSNYQFKQWNDGDKKYDFNQEVRENKTLQIVWEKVASVTIKTTGGITLYFHEFATLNEALLVANDISSVISAADLSRVGSVTVKLLKDISDTLNQPVYQQNSPNPMPGYAYYPIRSDMTLDLNGHKHTENFHGAGESTEIYLVTGTQDHAPKFTVTDSTSDGKGTITTNIPGSAAIRVTKENAEVTVKKGTVAAGETSVNAAAIRLSVPAKLIVEGGTVTSPYAAADAADGASVEVKGGTVSAKQYGIYSRFTGSDPMGIGFTMSSGYVKGTGTADGEGYAIHVSVRANEQAEAKVGPVRGEITGGNMYGKAYLENLSMGIVPAFTLKGGYYSEDSHTDLSAKMLILASGYSWADSPAEKKAEGYPWTVEKEATVKFKENGGKPHPANQIVKIGEKVKEPYVYKANKKLDGWYTKDGSTIDPQTGEPDWGKKWDFKEALKKDDLDKDNVLTLTAKWKDTDKFVAKVTYASGAAEKNFTELGAAFNEVLADGDKVTMLADYQIPDAEGLKDEHQYMVNSKSITFDLAGFHVSGNTGAQYTGLLRIGRGTSAVVDDTSAAKSGSLENTGTLPTLYTEGALEIKNAEILHELREGSGDVISGTKNGSVTVKEKNTRIKGHLADSTCTFVLSAGRYEEKPVAKHVADKYIAVKNDDAKTLSQGYNYMIIRGDGTASLLVAGYDFFVNGVQQKSYYVEEFPVGTEITLDYKGDVKDFSCWADDFYRTLSTEPSYTFALTKDIVIACVSAQMIKKGESVIVYKSDDDILNTGFYHVSDIGEIVDTAGKALEEPERPQPSDGRTFKQWSLQKSEILQKMQDDVPIITVEAVFEGSQEDYTVKVTSGTLIEGGATVTPVSGGGKFKAGEVTTVTAVDPDPQKTGKYQFLGWFVKKDGEDSFVPLGGADAWKLSFTYTVTEKVTLKAVFRPLTTFNLAVKAEDFSVSVNGEAFADYHTEYKAALPAGTVTLRFNEKPGKKFKYWVNDSQKVCSRTPEFTFTLVADADIYAVYYDEKSEGSSYVIYESAYGMVISSRLYTTGSEIVPPRVPQVTGKTAVGWDKTVDEIKALIGTESCIVVRPVYENKEGTYSVTVKYTYTDETGTIDLRSQESYPDIPIATSKELRAEPQIIVEDEADGTATYHFHSWKLNGVIVSTSPRYFAYGTTDGEEIAVTACYSKAEQKPEPLVKITKSSAGWDDARGRYVYSFTQYYDVPEGYEILEIGSLRTVYSAYATDQHMVVNSDYAAVRKQIFALLSRYGECRLNATNTNATTYYYRGYIIVKDETSGVITTYYSDIKSQGVAQ